MSFAALWAKVFFFSLTAQWRVVFLFFLSQLHSSNRLTVTYTSITVIKELGLGSCLSASIVSPLLFIAPQHHTYRSFCQIKHQAHCPHLLPIQTCIWKKGAKVRRNECGWKTNITNMCMRKEELKNITGQGMRWWKMIDQTEESLVIKCRSYLWKSSLNWFTHCRERERTLVSVRHPANRSVIF